MKQLDLRPLRRRYSSAKMPNTLSDLTPPWPLNADIQVIIALFPEEGVIASVTEKVISCWATVERIIR